MVLVIGKTLLFFSSDCRLNTNILGFSQKVNALETFFGTSLNTNILGFSQPHVWYLNVLALVSLNTNILGFSL